MDGFKGLNACVFYAHNKLSFIPSNVDEQRRNSKVDVFGFVRWMGLKEDGCIVQ